jgi:hypothetical protein
MSRKNGHSSSEKRWIKTKLELARLLGISRTTLDNFTLLPGFPARAANGHFPLEECRAFVAGQLGRNEEKRALELQKLRDEVSRGQLELMKAAGEVVPLDWSRRIVAHMAISLRRIIQGASIDEAEKEKMTAAVEGIDVEGFIAQLAREEIAEGPAGGA